MVCLATYFAGKSGVLVRQASQLAHLHHKAALKRHSSGRDLL